MKGVLELGGRRIGESRLAYSSVVGSLVLVLVLNLWASPPSEGREGRLRRRWRGTPPFSVGGPAELKRFWAYGVKSARYGLGCAWVGTAVGVADNGCPRRCACACECECVWIWSGGDELIDKEERARER